MLLICSRIFVVRQSNKLFVIREQKGDEQLFVNLVPNCQIFSKKSTHFLKVHFLSQKSSMKYNKIVNLSHKNGIKLGKCEKNQSYNSRDTIDG